MACLPVCPVADCLQPWRPPQEQTQAGGAALENEMSYNEALIEERDQGITEIAQQIGEVNEIFQARARGSPGPQRVARAGPRPRAAACGARMPGLGPQRVARVGPPVQGASVWRARARPRAPACGARRPSARGRSVWRARARRRVSREPECVLVCASVCEVRCMWCTAGSVDWLSCKASARMRACSSGTQAAACRQLSAGPQDPARLPCRHACDPFI
jgi:hypothetical protein